MGYYDSGTDYAPDAEVDSGDKRGKEKSKLSTGSKEKQKEAENEVMMEEHRKERASDKEANLDQSEENTGEKELHQKEDVKWIQHLTLPPICSRSFMHLPCPNFLNH